MLEKTAKAIRSIICDLPDGSSAFLFGSVLRREDFNDVDVLILYNPLLCPPQTAWNAHGRFVNEVQKAFGKSVHLELLTFDEERETGFVARARAVRIR
jgi:predicted nucleotidyltransferase